MTQKEKIQKAKDLKSERVWSKKDLAILKDLVKDGCTTSDVFNADVFPNRSMSKIRGQINKL